MVKIGIVQTREYSSDQKAIQSISKVLRSLGRKEADLVCLPEQWLCDNRIQDYDKQFAEFKEIAKNYSMTIIPGAFYERRKHRFVISSPVIGPGGDIIGMQEKIHPFDYEQKLVVGGRQAKIFNTVCKFGVIVCYDMVFPNVVRTLAQKGAEVILSPSRIVKRGINPWHMYVQVRALENRIPILAANVLNEKFGGKSIIVDMTEDDRVMIPQTTTFLSKQYSGIKNFNLSKLEKSRSRRYSDARNFS